MFIQFSHWWELFKDLGPCWPSHNSSWCFDCFHGYRVLGERSYGDNSWSLCNQSYQNATNLMQTNRRGATCFKMNIGPYFLLLRDLISAGEGEEIKVRTVHLNMDILMYVLKSSTLEEAMNAVVKPAVNRQLVGMIMSAISSATGEVGLKSNWIICKIIFCEDSFLDTGKFCDIPTAIVSAMNQWPDEHDFPNNFMPLCCWDTEIRFEGRCRCRPTILHFQTGRCASRWCTRCQLVGLLVLLLRRRLVRTIDWTCCSIKLCCAFSYVQTSNITGTETLGCN